MGEQREYRDPALEPRQFPAIVQIDRVVRDTAHYQTEVVEPLSFERFAQHAFDYVADSLDRAHERIEQLTAERDWALEQLRELEREQRVVSSPKQPPTSARPWQALLMRSPQEPVSRVRWAIAFLFLLALPIAGLVLVEPGSRARLHAALSHTAVLEPAIIAALLVVLVITWTLSARR